MKKRRVFTLAGLLVFCMCFISLAAVSAKTGEKQNQNTVFTYYYNQLTTPEARGIYRVLSEMLSDGSLKTGGYTVDLVEEGVLENKMYNQQELMADFSSARDAFMFDHSDIFYVDFDKLSITQTQMDAENYRITMGIGRDISYYYEGFDQKNVDAAIKEFNERVDEIAELVYLADDEKGKSLEDRDATASDSNAAASDSDATASSSYSDKNTDIRKKSTKRNFVKKNSPDEIEYLTLREQIEIVYSEIVRNVVYKLEKDAKEENVLYVRTPYGALVRGESVCEGYARGLKAVLDELDIDNVLVQGTYVDVDTEKAEPHMWNYVKMEDNRWYLLDATMDVGFTAGEVTDESDLNYFLRYGLEDVVKYYQPDGVISLSNTSFEFMYPELSASEYKEMSTAFTVSEELSEDDNHYISYKGMGIEKSSEEGKYLVGSYDGEEWYYVRNHFLWSIAITEGGSPNDYDVSCDFETYFENVLKYSYMAVTTQAPQDFLEGNQYAEYYTYTGKLSQLFDQSQIDEAIELTKAAPYIVSREPISTRLKGNKTYTIQVQYSESLKLGNAAAKADIKWLSQVPGASISDFTWDGDKGVQFKLKTVSGYAFTTPYYFALENLLGKETGKVPNPICYSVVNNPVFGCPKVASSLNTIYANTPALIANDDLSTEGWQDENGNPISQNLPNRLALVASTISEEKQDELIGEIETETGGQVLGSQTFDISLTLCSGQVSYITGRKVKVYIPFPEGFTSESNVSFKAYHFDKNGNPEEVDCVTTEKGIIIMCNSFSPYAVVAMAKDPEATEKKVVLFAEGGGSFDQESLTLTEGMNGSVEITVNEGYKLEKLLLNGTELDAERYADGKLELLYRELLESGNVLEGSFIVADIQVGENEIPDEGNKPGDGEDPDEGNKPGDGEDPDEGNKPGDGEDPDDDNKPNEGSKPENNKPDDRNDSDDEDREPAESRTENKDSDEVLTYDAKKGMISSKYGILTGNSADGRSAWMSETMIAADGTIVEKWKLQYADGSYVKGNLITDENGNTREQYLWEYVNGNWWTFDSLGYAQTGWIYDSDYQYWFYLHTEYGMQTGWVQLNGLWYYLNPESDGNKGAMYASCWTPDGYYVDANGVWDGRDQMIQ